MAEHDLIFYAKRSTPKVVDHGADDPEVPDGYGAKRKRRAATDEEEKVLARGDWLRVDEDGNTPGDRDYKKSDYRPQND